MKNKGFTLIELLAIIVVIAIIATITTPVILNMIEKSKKEAAEQSANGFKDAIEKYYMNSSINEDEEFDLEGEYIIQDGIISGENLDNIKINVSGDIPTNGILIYEESEIKTGCLTFNEYSVYFEENKVSNVEKGECLNINTEYTFDYTGGEQTFKAPQSGYYKLEVWGAQGGSASNTYIGGYGGYSTGIIKLNANDIIYINVGGQGLSGPATEEKVYGDEGYNGGGKRSGWDCSSCVYYSSGGGGATHVAKVSGLITNLESEKGTYDETKETYISEKILIVAGGGGGNGYVDGGWNIISTNIASGGGFQGNYGANPSSDRRGQGGTQNSSYQSNCSTSGVCDGGGGGFFGGERGMNNAGGGSGYIGNESLTNKSMYCYGCEESNKTYIKTISTTGTSNERDTTNCPNGYSNNPISKCAKTGNGYAKITYIGVTLN